MKFYNRKLVLEDGTEYLGYGFGSNTEKICEIVFNTSMVGYQEMVSDPSCINKMVVMTYPLIGNYGITDEDYKYELQEIMYRAQNDKEEIEPVLQRMYDRAEREMNYQYERSVI